MADNNTFEQNDEFSQPGLQNDDPTQPVAPITGINLQSTGSNIDVTNEQNQTDRLGKLIRTMIGLAPVGTDESIVTDACLQLLQAYDNKINLQVTTPYGQMFDTGWATTQLVGL